MISTTYSLDSDNNILHLMPINITVNLRKAPGDINTGCDVFVDLWKLLIYPTCLVENINLALLL